MREFAVAAKMFQDGIANMFDWLKLCDLQLFRSEMSLRHAIDMTSKYNARFSAFGPFTAIVASSLLSVCALAVPYATDLKYADGTVSFRLNEPADDVMIVWDNGARTNDLGSLPKGLFTTNIADLTQPFKVVVSRSAPGGWTQTSNDNDNTVKFNSPRGLAVNTRPASPYFGRVYIANSAAGTAGGRSVGDGIYVLNSDQTDALGQGDSPLTAGLNFTTGGASSPYRVKLGEDDTVYITDWSDGAGNLYLADPNLSADSGQLVFPPLVTNVLTGTIGVNPVGSANNHGSIDSVVVVGSLAKGNLVVYTVDEDLQSDREDATKIMLDSVWRYEIGTGPLPYAGEPPAEPFFKNPAMGAYGGQFMDLDRGPDGKLYLANRRQAGNEPGVYVIDESGNLLWDSVTATRELKGPTAADILAGTVSAAVSPDGRYLATISYYDNHVTVVEMKDGIPDLTKYVVFAPFGTTAAGRYIAFDAAGNIHVISSGYALYRVFSPGGFTIATTGSDGTFAVATPPSVVTVVASSNTTSEGSATPGEFVFTRQGDLTGELTVKYVVEGTATNGADYQTLSGTVTFPAGAETVTVQVTAIDDDLAEAPETVTVRVESGQKYTAGTPGSAMVTILDNDQPAISIATKFPTAYERTAGDYVAFRLTRLGDTTVDVYVNIAYSGTAQAADFTGPDMVAIPAGATTQDFEVYTVDNNKLDGDRTLVATVATGTGYTVGSPDSATATILDDELPSETDKILFADNFDTDTSANWNILFGANNNVDDKDVLFAYDYYNLDLVPPAPNGSTLGLKLTVNKYDPTSYGAAGVNLYPKNLSLSGNYAVRFNMFIMVNTVAGTTEHALFGVNHSGAKTNWVRQTSGNVQNPAYDADGIWFAIVADASQVNGLGHVCYTGNGPSNPPMVLANRSPLDLAGVFKSPPFNAGDSGIGGSPACVPAATAPNWSDVEVRCVDDTITLLINRSVVLEVTNSTPYKVGTIMLGYNDQFDSIGNVGAVYFDNLRVVRLDSVTPKPPVITGIAVDAGQAVITFTAAGSEAGQLTVLGSTTVGGPYAAVSNVMIKPLGNDRFEAVIPVSGPMQFYRIAR